MVFIFALCNDQKTIWKNTPKTTGIKYKNQLFEICLTADLPDYLALYETINLHKVLWNVLKTLHKIKVPLKHKSFMKTLNIMQKRSQKETLKKKTFLKQ